MPVWMWVTKRNFIQKTLDTIRKIHMTGLINIYILFVALKLKDESDIDQEEEDESGEDWDSQEVQWDTLTVLIQHSYTFKFLKLNGKNYKLTFLHT